MRPKEGWKLAATRKTCSSTAGRTADSNLKEFKAIAHWTLPLMVSRSHRRFENYPKFMPTLGMPFIKREATPVIGYQRLSPKIVEDRDYTFACLERYGWPQRAEYLSQWQTANEMGPPEQKGVVRLKVLQWQLAA